MTDNEALKNALEKVKAQKVNFGFMERFNVDENHEVIKAIEEIQQYRAIGTIEEFKSLKENQCKCEDCAGCTVWKCDYENSRQQAIDDFSNLLFKAFDETNIEEYGFYPKNVIRMVVEQLKAGGPE